MRFVQYREKDLPYEERLRLGREVASLANQHGARLLVNGDIELAEALGADGVHLGKGTVSVSAVRAGGYAGLIGYSAHSGEEAARAFAEGADFATLSPVFPTNSKFSSGPLLGLEAFARECEAAGGPVYALGGVGAQNASACLERGRARRSAYRRDPGGWRPRPGGAGDARGAARLSAPACGC